MTDTDSNHGVAAHAAYDFSFPAPRETLVRVERARRRVLIRASRNTFGEARKKSFVHELAAEGFIPDEYSSFETFEKSPLPILWIVDSTWVMPGKEARADTNRFMLRTLLAGSLLWAGSLLALFLTH